MNAIFFPFSKIHRKFEVRVRDSKVEMQRPLFLKQIETQMKVHPVCGVLGPRQAGKTTLYSIKLKSGFNESTPATASVRFSSVISQLELGMCS